MTGPGCSLEDAVSCLCRPSVRVRPDNCNVPNGRVSASCPTVNRARLREMALIATGRNLHITDKVVAAMPLSIGGEVELVFFKPKPDAYNRGWISEVVLRAEYERRGLEPDPIAQAAVNEADPAFASKHPNGTHWLSKDGTWCYAAFYVGNGSVTYMCNELSSCLWDSRWIFAGRRECRQATVGNRLRQSLL